MVQDLDRVPDDFAVGGLRGGGGEDAEEADNGEDEGDDDCLDILCAGLVGVT